MLYIWCAHLFENLKMPRGQSEAVNQRTKNINDFVCSVGKWLGLGLWCLTPLSLVFPKTIFSHEYTRGNGWIGLSMMLSPTFNNMSVISWRSVLFVKEIGVPGENHQPSANH